MNLKSTGTTVFAAAAAIALSAGLSACGSDNTTGGSASSSATGQPGSSACAGKAKLSAEGSSAQKNAFDIFSNEYSSVCPGKSISYNPTGSGAGREQFISRNVDFAGSDSALSDADAAKAKDRCGGNDAWNLPVVFGPIALAYNLPGVDKLVLSGDTLAKIFTGAIASWNDPAIAALNPGVTLPDTKVTPIYRADKSGTSENFGKYLSTAAPQSWDKGSDATWQGGAGQGREKSAGVIELTQSTPGAITYVEKGYADDLKVPYAQIDNGGGAVALTPETAAASVNTAKIAGEGNNLKLDLASIYGTKEAGAYPVVLATYEIVCSKGYDADTAAAVKSFLTVAVDQGQKGLAEAGYAPLPDQFKSRLETAINAIS